MSKKYECVFLDRDGTINIDPGYISNLKHFKFYDYTFKALKLLKTLSNNFIIITNQSGVSRGLIKEKNLIKINHFIHWKFAENELNLLKIYYCTDHPENATEFRKPGTGMFLQASREYDINLSKCIMIGDSHKDIMPTKELGMDSMLVLSGIGKVEQNKFDEHSRPDYVAKNLFFGAKELVN